MPPKAKAMPSLSGFIDSDDAQSDVEMMPTPDSNQENKPAAKAKRGGRAATVIKRGRPASKRLSAGKPKTLKARAAARRAPLKDQTNAPQQSDIEEVDDEFDEPVVAKKHNPPAHEEQGPEDDSDVQVKKAPAKKGRPPGKAKKAAAAKAVAEQSTGVERDGEFEYTPTTTRTTTKKGPKGKGASTKATTDEIVIEEPQQDKQDQEDATMLSIEQDEIAPQPAYRPVPPRSNSRRPQSYTDSNARRRAGSASDTDRGASDPATRRKLGELTRKFESIEIKYRNLRDVGVKEAEANFERLRKQSEERTKAANDLISSLRSELTIQKDINKESRNHQSDLSASKASLKDAENRLSELTKALTQVQNDNRNLQAKLTASRAASVNAESSKVPSSVIKGRTAAAKIGSSESAQAMQSAQLKEELYSDLTGLIIRGVDRQEDSDVYDCIQTGKNGTLHFKLAVATDQDSTTSYEDTQLAYIPRLDQNRDAKLIDILPDYLTEEITFSRTNSIKFYNRMFNTLNRTVED